MASLCDWVANGDLVKFPEELLFLHPELAFLELCQQLRLLSWLYLVPPFTPAGNLISVQVHSGLSGGKRGAESPKLLPDPGWPAAQHTPLLSDLQKGPTVVWLPIRTPPSQGSPCLRTCLLKAITPEPGRSGLWRSCHVE